MLAQALHDAPSLLGQAGAESGLFGSLFAGQHPPLEQALLASL